MSISVEATRHKYAMLLQELYSAKSGVHEVYHWTSAEYLRQIIDQDQINIGASTHQLNGKTLHGVSLTRNPFFDIQNTFAVSGRKSWRIGLDYQKLRHNIRVIPIRDEYLRNKPAGVRAKQEIRAGIFGQVLGHEHVSHDESEEFALGDINLSRYMTSIAFEDQFVDFTCDPRDVQDDPQYLEDEYGYEVEDILMLWGLVQELHPEFMNYFKRKYPKFRAPTVYLHNHVPLRVINREYGTQTDFTQHYRWVLPETID